MRSFAPRPILLVLTLLLIAGAIYFIQFRFQPADADDEQARANPSTSQESGASSQAQKQEDAETDRPGNTERQKSEPAQSAETRERSKSGPEPEQAKQHKQEPTISDAERISLKEAKYPRAKEIVDPTGFINTDGVSIKEAAGEKVVLLDFWTYSCYNCQNTQPYINSWQKEYEDDGLLIIGVHKPEFEFEKDYASVTEAVRQAGITYPVVLDNNDATWNAYNQSYWPTWYLIDADGFVRYKHIGEGAYDETEKKIQDLLAERNQLAN